MPFTPPSPLGFSGSPLVNDDPALRSPTPLEFSGSPAGLDLARPSAPAGLQPPNPGFTNGAPDFAGASQQIQNIFNTPMPTTMAPSTEAQIYFSPSTGNLVVNGFRFNQRNASQALVSEDWANQPRQRFTLPDDATDWREMSRAEYDDYLNTIKNPGFGRRVGEAWEQAWRSAADIGTGAILAVDPENEWANNVHQSFLREYEENAPFMLSLRDAVQSPEQGLTYMAQMAVQGVPWLVETMVSMGIGALAGGAVSGGVGAPAGAVEAFVAKEGLRQAARGAVQTVLRNNIRRGATAYLEAQAERGAGSLLRTSSALSREDVLAFAARTGRGSADDINRFFDFGERAYHMSRASVGGSGAAQAGAGALMFGSNYATGVGDIRNSMEQAGVDPRDADAATQIWGMAIPYALMESAGDLILTQPIARMLPGLGSGPSRVANALTHGGITAVAEGLEEGGQYGVTQQAIAGATQRPIDIDPYDLMENVVGGALAGGPLGAFTGLIGPTTPRPVTPTEYKGSPEGTPSGPMPGPTDIPPTGSNSGYDGSMGGLDLNADPNDTNPNYVGYAEQQAMRNNALGHPPVPMTYDGEGSMGGLDLSQNPNDTNPNYVGYAEQQAMRNNAITDVGPTTVTPPQVNTQAPRSPAAILRDLEQSKPIAPQEFQILRDEVRRQQMADPTNPDHTEMINYINDAEAEQNTKEPPFNWEDATRRNLDTGENLSGSNPVAFDGLPMYGKHREDTPEGKALLERMLLPLRIENAEKRGRTEEAVQLRGRLQELEPTVPNTDKLSVVRDHMGRTKGITASMENVLGAEARRQYMERPRLTASQKKNKKRKLQAYQENQPRGGFSRADVVPQQQRELENRDREAEAKETKKEALKAKVAAKKKAAAETAAQAEAVANETKAAAKKKSADNIKAAAANAKKAAETAPAVEEPKPNRSRVKAAAAAAKEAAETKPTPAEEPIDNARVERSIKALKYLGDKEGKTLFETRQRVSNLIRSVKKNNKLDPDKYRWYFGQEGERKLTLTELHKIADHFKEITGSEKGKSKKTEASPKAKMADIISSDVEDEWTKTKDPTKGSMETFKAFVLDNVLAVQAWVDTEAVSTRIPKAREAAIAILAERPTQKNAHPDDRSKKENRGNPHGRPVGSTIASRIMRREMLRDPKFTFKAIHPATRARANEVIEEIWAEQDKAGIKRSDKDVLYSNQTQLRNTMLKRGELIRDPTTGRITVADRPTQKNADSRLPRRIIDVKTSDGPSKIIINPTREDVTKMTRTPLGADRFKHDLARVIVDDNGNVYIGNGYYFIHDQIVDVVEDNGYTVAGYVTHDMPQDGHGETAITGVVVNKNSHLTFEGVTEELMWPKKNAQKNTQVEATKGHITFREGRTAVNKVQQHILPKFRFRTTHIFKNINDFIGRATSEYLVHPTNGKNISVDHYIRGEVALMRIRDKSLDNKTDKQLYKEYVMEHFYSKAAVMPHYNALFLFTDYIENTHDLAMTLEHEIIGHKGIAVLFKTDAARREFFQNAMKIPGFREKMDQLVADKPTYKNESPERLAEEVLTHHIMYGPLAIERLLSAEEAVSEKTGRTLWEELKRVIKEWVDAVFGPDRKTVDKALDDLVMHLREFALTGETRDPMLTVYKYATGATEAQMQELLNDPEINRIMRSVVDEPLTPEQTQELLYGTNTDKPARPYTPKPIGKDLYGTLTGVEPMVEKLKEVASRNIGAPVKEQLKKISQELVTMNQMALVSPLIERMMQIMHNTIKTARNIMTRVGEERQYDSKSAATARIRALWGDKFPGSTPEQLADANQMMILATNNRMAQVIEDNLSKEARLLTRNIDGTYDINTAVFDELLKRGTVTKEEWLAGIEQFTVNKKGEVTSNGVVNLSKEQIERGYEIYLSETKVMAKTALTVLEHRAMALTARGDQSVEDILRDIEFDAKDQPFAREALLRMRKLYADIAFHNYANKTKAQRFAQKEMAREVLVELQRAFWKKDKVADWTDSRVARSAKMNPRGNDAFKWREQISPHDDVKPFVDQIRWFLKYDESFGKNRMQRIFDLGVSESQQYDMMNAFQSLINAETQAHELENDVIQTILGNYFEMVRSGEWRVALEVRDVNGNDITDINPEVLAALPTTYTMTQREAIELQKQWKDEFAGTFKIKNAAGDGEVLITFDVSRAAAPGMKTMGDAPKVREFLKVAELAGLTLKPHQMKVIANLIETAAVRKRLGLQRANTPGADADILRNNRETITRRAWQAAKASQAWMLESTMTDRRNQYGDWEHLAALQRDFDIAYNGAPHGQATPIGFVRNPSLIDITERDLIRYAHQLRHVARHTIGRPTVNIRTTKGELKLKIEGQAEMYIKHANSLKSSLEKDEIDINLQDFVSRTGALRQFAVVSQLGTIASGIMNAYTPLTHLPWRLGAKHPKTGYGEGFAYSDIIAEIMTAMTQVMPLWKNMSDSTKVKQMLEDAKAGNNKTGMTIAELEDMYQETLDGLLMPQQTYSLTGGTESNIRDLAWRNFSNMLLSAFSSVEAATRRVAWLVTHRLAKKRYIASGIPEDVINNPKSKEHERLVRDIEAVVFDSQGDYANINRPRSFRGPWMQYILQYKMFPLITVLLANNLPLAERAMMLGVLGALAGLKGEPFADDFADIYDTLLQAFGFKHDSVELQLTRAFEDILPGSSNWIMHGAVDNFADFFGVAGGTTSSRLSMGDIIPLTGLFRPEADFGREIANAFGPAYAANVDALEWAGTVADFALQIAGAKPRTTPWEDLIRRFPQGQVRGIFEAGQMMATGQILDPNGRVVSDDVTAMTYFTRALGFYPLEASQANTAVRLDRMHDGYMKAVRARFILAYANAYRAGNTDDMERINDAVRDWNEAVEQSGQDDMVIGNFRSAAVRAGRAASRTTIERTSEGAADYSIIDEVAGILNADDETN